MKPIKALVWANQKENFPMLLGYAYLGFVVGYMIFELLN